jgi:hypothetical protein
MNPNEESGRSKQPTASENRVNNNEEEDAM